MLLGALLLPKKLLRKATTTGECDDGRTVAAIVGGDAKNDEEKAV